MLQIITLGIASIYVVPYRCCTDAELYKILRDDYIKNKKNNYEKFNDEALFNNKEGLLVYPNSSSKMKTKSEQLNEEYRVTKYDGWTLVLLFFFFSVVGWIWEVVLIGFETGIIANRGAMYGPWLPIYGTGCLTLIIISQFFESSKLKRNPFLTFISTAVVCTIIEYISSFYLEAKLGIRYWDYTGNFMNLNGRVCLEGSIFFGLGGTICMYFIAPMINKKLGKIKLKYKVPLCIILMLLFSFDAIFSIFHPHTGNGITNISEAKQVQEEMQEKDVEKDN